jgi:hypothetical protein
MHSVAAHGGRKAVPEEAVTDLTTLAQTVIMLRIA